MPSLSEYVIDTSALLALLNGEPGAETVRPLLPASVISAVNFCETVHKLRRRGIPIETVRATLTTLVSPPVPFDESLAYITASIHEKTRGQGISLADCACLGLALSRNTPAVTTDKAWGAIDVGVEIIQVR